MKKLSHAVFAFVLGAGTAAMFIAYEGTQMPFAWMHWTLRYFSFAGLIVVFSMLGARLPDIIEPGWNKGHRSFFHSRKMGLLLSGLLIIDLLLLDRLLVFGPLIAGFIVGYESHLFLDSWSKGGLPK